jgi:hypothetical protein
MIEWIPGALWQWFLVRRRRVELIDYTAEWRTFRRVYGYTLMLCLLIATPVMAEGGADFTIRTPQGTAHGYNYPDGSFIIRGPGAPLPPASKPYDARDFQQNDSYYGQRHGDMYIITNPGADGPTFGYGLMPKELH